MSGIILEHTHTIVQPAEVSLRVEMKIDRIDSNEQKTSSIEIKTTRHLEKDENIAKEMDTILAISLERCKETIKKAMEE